MAPLSLANEAANLNVPASKIKRDLSCYALEESEAAVS